MVKTPFIYFLLFPYFVRGWSSTDRLPRNAFPKSYSLKIVPNLENNNYIGEVTIFIQVEHPLDSILLNCKCLTIKKVTLDYAVGGFIRVSSDLLSVQYLNGKKIYPGEHILHMKFRGSLADNYGFYSITEKNSTILVTKFSPMSARSAFPCFDEPYFKSSFAIRLVKPHNSSWKALSNMNEIGQYNTREGVAVDFNSTIPMSTYLLAWILTDYTFDEITYDNGEKNISLRLFTEENRADQRIKLLNATKNVLEFYEKYTGIPYMLHKLDSIEIPEYESEGMEHWGLIVYQQNKVTRKSSNLNSILMDNLDALKLIGHEVSHMWFGNLVTHQWYNDFWLTESFAEMMQYKALYSIVKEPFVNSILQYKKTDDDFIDLKGHCDSENYNYQEMVRFTEDKTELNKAFKTAYKNGAEFLQMLEDIIGHEHFRKIIRKYLEKHKFSYATTADFMNTVQSGSGMNLRSMIETYLLQKSFPLVNVFENDKSYSLKQQPICASFSNKWTIPIKYITSTNRTTSLIWFDKDMDEVIIPKSREDKWIKINHLNKGFYASNYSNGIFSALEEDFEKLESDDKGSLIQDYCLLSSPRDSCHPAKFMKYLQEEDYSVFKYAIEWCHCSSIQSYVANFSLSDCVNHPLEPVHRIICNGNNSNEALTKRLWRTTILEYVAEGSKKKLLFEDLKKMKDQNSTIFKDVKHIYRSLNRNVNLKTED